MDSREYITVKFAAAVLPIGHKAWLYADQGISPVSLLLYKRGETPALPDVAETLIKAQKRSLTRRYSQPGIKKLMHIAIDEISVKKGHQYLTIVMDLKSGAVVFVGDRDINPTNSRRSDGFKTGWISE